MLTHIQTCLSLFWTLKEKINSKICSDQSRHVQDILRHVQMCYRHIQTYSGYVNTFFHTCPRNNSTWYTAVKTCSIKVETCQTISIACLDMLQTSSVFPKISWYVSSMLVHVRYFPGMFNHLSNVKTQSRFIRYMFHKCSQHIQTYSDKSFTWSSHFKISSDMYHTCTNILNPYMRCVQTWPIYVQT